MGPKCNYREAKGGLTTRSYAWKKGGSNVTVEAESDVAQARGILTVPRSCRR